MRRIRPLILFGIGGLVYTLLEIIVRGRTHWTMFIVGGVAFFLIGCINEKYRNMALVKQMIIGALVITLLELVCGCIVNLWLGWNVWDYSNMPFNLLGQVCIPFSILWFLLSAVAVVLDDWIRHLLWNEEMPHYNFFRRIPK